MGPAMAAPIQELIENIRDGFVLLNGDGEARYCNAAAKAALGEDVKRLAQAAGLRVAVKSAIDGKLRLPVSLLLETGDGKTPIPCVLIHAPIGSDLALLIQPPVAATAQPALANLLELIRGVLLRPVKSLVAALPAPEAEGGTDPVARNLREVSAELEKLVEFAAIFGEDRLDATDRIVMKDLVCELWHDLSAFAASRNIEVSMSGFSADLPPIYGNQEWMRRVVRELLDNAIRHSKNTPPPGSKQKSQIEISARQLGPHLVLSMRNAGVGVLPKIADRKFLPFNHAAGQRKEFVKSLSLGLPLVHKLIELHGGRVKIGGNEDDMTECVIELPTGAPQRDASRLDLQQAKRYAEDLGKLMMRRKRPAAA